MPGSAAPVFASYSHKDHEWLERARPYLRPLHRENSIDLWDDTRIHAGEQWREEIQGALGKAKMAVLLVSQDFLDSDFIQQHELPPLLEAAKKQGLTILWVPLRPCTFENTPLENYQAVGKPNAPLNSLSQYEADLVFKQLHERIREIAGTTAHTTPEGEPVFLVPFEQNTAFTGRVSVLEELDRTLLQNGTGALSQTAAIAGLGGVGKTQTAVEYAYRHKHQYTAVFWAVAESEGTLATGYAEIARRLGLTAATEQQQSAVRDAVKSWLEQHEGWLLVLDNADTPALVKSYLPRQHRGCVLLTSRAYTLQDLGVWSPVRLDTLLPEEACAFLLTRTGRDPAALSKAENNAARMLAEELGYLPLALEQAAAYLVETAAGFAAYLASYRKRRLPLLESHKPLLGERTDSVATTWLMNFAEVEKSPASADLLRLSAFLAPDEIPLDLLAQGYSEIKGSLRERLAEAAEDPLVLDELLAPLLHYSLIKREPGTVSFSMHRLTQAVVRERLEEQQRQFWAESTVALLAVVFPSTEFETWPTCSRLIVHAQTSSSWIERFQITSNLAASLLNQAGYFLKQRGQYHVAEPLLRQALEIRKQVLGTDHHETATIMNNLALLLMSTDKLAEAESLYRRVLPILEKEFGKDHLNIAWSANNLALILKQKGDFQEAEQLFRRALAISCNKLGRNHPNTALVLENLACLLHDAGDLVKSELLHRRAVETYKQVSNSSHPNMARSLNNLAFLLHTKKGELVEAELLYCQALTIYEHSLGLAHPDTVKCLNSLALLLEQKGNFTEAEELRKRARSQTDESANKRST